MKKRRRNNRNTIGQELLINRFKRGSFLTYLAIGVPILYVGIAYLCMRGEGMEAWTRLLPPEPWRWMKLLGLLVVVYSVGGVTNVFRHTSEESQKKNRYYFAFSVLVLLCNPLGLADWRVPFGALLGGGLYGLISWVTQKREKREILFLLYFAIPLLLYWLEPRFVLLLVLLLLGLVLVVNISVKELLSSVLGLTLSVGAILALEYLFQGSVTVIEQATVQLNTLKAISVVSPDDQYFILLALLWLLASLGMNENNRQKNKLARTQTYLNRYYYVMMVVTYALFMQKNVLLYGMVLHGSAFVLADYFGTSSGKEANSMLYMFLAILLFFLFQPFLFDSTIFLFRWIA